MKSVGVAVIAALLLSAAVAAGVVTVTAINNSNSSNDQNSAIPDSYTITYVMNGGINSEDNPSSYEVGENVIFKDPSYTGYTFDGWYTDAGFTNRIAEISSGSSGNVTVYAKWIANTYSITYVMNGGINSENNPSSYSTGDNVIFKDPSYTGYTFEGWYTDAGFTNGITQISGTSYGNVTVYAKWSVSIYDITYVMNGGINSDDNPSTYTIGDEIVFSDPSYSGCTFLGWYSDTDLSDAITGIGSDDTGDITVYAKWQFTIQYVLNGGINSDDNPATYSTGDEVTFDEPTYDGYVFAGWYTDDGFTDIITGVDSDTDGNITVYALWEESSVGLVLNYDIDGSVSSRSRFSNTTNLISGTISYSYLHYRYDKGYLMSYDESYTVTYYSGSPHSYSRTFTGSDTYWTGDSDDMSWTMESETQTISTFEGNKECDVWIGKDSSHTETQYVGIESGLAYKIVYEKTSYGSATSITYELTSTGYVSTDDTYDVNVYCDDGISVSGSGTKDAYSEVTLTVTVDPGTVFKGWYDESGTLLSESTEYTIELLLLDTTIYALNETDPDVSYDMDEEGAAAGISPSIALTDVIWTYESESGTVTVSGPTLSIDVPGAYAVTYVGQQEDGSTYYGYLDVFVDGNVTKTYSWVYDENDYTTTLSIKYSDFLSYRNDDISRSQGTEAHDLEFVTYDDKYIVELAGKLKLLGEGFSDAEMAEFILNFTQYIEYQYDSDSVGEDEYWKYPLETLFDQNGDCEDTSILFCAIAKACGYDCCMLLFSGHMAAGISVSGITSTDVFTEDGVTYYYCETTSTGWDVGDVPTGYTQKGWRFQNLIAIPDSE